MEIIWGETVTVKGSQRNREPDPGALLQLIFIVVTAAKLRQFLD